LGSQLYKQKEEERVKSHDWRLVIGALQETNIHTDDYIEIQADKGYDVTHHCVATRSRVRDL
jgi:hypothetical protein